MSGFYHKHFLKLLDFTPAELNSLLQLAAKLKADKKSGKEEAKLTGKNIALIFEKDSTRTRCSFEVAAYDQGARVTYLGPSGSQIGHKESIKDTARVLGRMYDGIQYRGHGQEVVETLAQYAGVPVWNGLTNEFHPTQLLADLMTMQEHLPGKAFNEMTLVYRYSYSFDGETWHTVPVTYEAWKLSDDYIGGRGVFSVAVLCLHPRGIRAGRVRPRLHDIP